ncbi:RNA polymerase sigma-70 factor [Pinibacter aurantiacus]|uniref:RNA polymerase sigma-70 factor n=1 Tax=Pinibacter aurantiacus TaxID=2851599 RepID=A0A9E2S9Q9_9BACT|nr:RNA polymerase sigma-70 factor [Pinibacter aurantiacus]MBV4357264.1 RNA polymerase sigma-70 factor [Pinibacter aurantiacus]
MNNLNGEKENYLILQGIAANDQQSFRKLFDLFAHRLANFSQAILNSRETAVEVVDDVFVKLWKNRQQALDIQNISVYLYTAVKNSSLNYLSKKAKEQVTDPFDFININISADQTPEQKMITKELFKKIESAIDQLPPRCKMVFKLVREDGLKYKDVAEILNISINTVDAQMVIAVRRISESMRGNLSLPVVRLPQKNNRR